MRSRRARRPSEQPRCPRVSAIRVMWVAPARGTRAEASVATTAPRRPEPLARRSVKAANRAAAGARNRTIAVRPASVTRAFTCAAETSRHAVPISSRGTRACGCADAAPGAGGAGAVAVAAAGRGVSIVAAGAVRETRKPTAAGTPQSSSAGSAAVVARTEKVWLPSASSCAS